MRPNKLLNHSTWSFGSVLARATFILGLAFIAAPSFAQQTGEVSGYVTDSTGSALSGVAIEASSNVLPQARSVTSAANGRYRLPLLPPGNYNVTFTFADGSTIARPAAVRLQQETRLDIQFGVSQAALEEIVVTGEQLLADTGQGSLKNSIDAATVDALPVGQNYRDLMKLIPGVQYSEDLVRGPSAGGSGQDNGYQFDGVDVSLPLFGVLASEASSHDIAQVSVVRGGAKAIGFNRSGGFLMNTVSKSGTDEFHGEVGYQVQNSSMTGSLDTGDSPESFDEDRSWTTASIGGPILKDRLYFYTSYYRPSSTRGNVSNAYGPVGDYENTADEYFGKLTFSPTDNILLDASYRTSNREVVNSSVSAYEAATASLGAKATQDIAILAGSWVIDDASSVNFKYTDFTNENSSRPDSLFGFLPVQGDSLDVANLDRQGYFNVPQLRAEDTQSDIDFNIFAQPLIDQYGYLDGGVATGGGAVGGYYQVDDQDFFRTSFEIGYDRLFYVGNTTHDVHVGYQYMEVKEDLARRSNGWGLISAPGGRVNATDGVTPIYYEARVQQQSLQDGSGNPLIPSIKSRSELQSVEINDSIEIGDWTYNVGVLISNDVLYGQGLAPDASNPLTGLRQSPGTEYEMYEIDWVDMIQPRLSATWDFSDTSSVFFNFASYNPPASSLARAASWDRNLRSDIYVRFDDNGNFIEAEGVDSSSGKWFVEDMQPRRTNEYMVGMTQEVSSELTVRTHLRYRKSLHFWEDTGNWDRIDYGTIYQGVRQEAYIENLQDIRAEIGGSSYVIAELDGAYTKFYEASIEAEWNHENFFLRGSYVWSHYYGNFDQDNSTTDNDQAIFIGSSNIGDGAGRQLWDFKDGNLRGDRRHMLKIYGFYNLPWTASVGAYMVFQSGQPWEAWDSNVYRNLTSSTSDTIRYAEPAGSRTSPSHWQLDLNYTHNFALFGEHNLQLRADLFNLLDNQTGYNMQRRVNSSAFGEPTSFFNPRRFQLAVKYQF